MSQCDHQLRIPIADWMRRIGDCESSDFVCLPNQAAFTHYWALSLNDRKRYSIRIAIHREIGDQ